MSKCVKCETANKLNSFDQCLECIKYVLEKPEVVISNVLAYVNSYRSGHSRLKVQLACLKSFSMEDISSAKEALYKEYESILGTPTKRLGSSKKSRSEFNMEDIYEAFVVLDKKDIVVICVADNVKLLPKFHPEELELSSILERLLKLENKTEDHEKRLDHNVAIGIKHTGDIEDSRKLVQNIDNEVKNCIKIVADTRSEVRTHEDNVTLLQTVIEQEKISYANTIKNGRSDGRNVTSGSQHLHFGNRSNNNNGSMMNSRPQMKSYYGSSKSGTTNSKEMGAPLPSRFIVVERVPRHISKEDICGNNSFMKKILRFVQ